MNSTATHYQRANQALTAILETVPAERWTSPSPCEGWVTRDVVRHMIETQREFLTEREIELVPRQARFALASVVGRSARQGGGAKAMPSIVESTTTPPGARRAARSGRTLLDGALGPEPDVDADPAEAWVSHAQRVEAILSDDAVVAIAYDGHFGPTTVGATLEQFYIWDMVVHRWDIARSVGADDAVSDAEIDRLEAGADSFGEALYMDGVCRPGVEAPTGADRKARLLARLGRRA